jgi:hypothetical protein
VRTPLGETVLESIGEIAVWAVICLVGGVFIFMWGKHPALLIVGIAMFRSRAGGSATGIGQLREGSSGSTRGLMRPP